MRAKAKWERAETIREALQHSEQCLASNDPKQAEKALTAALRRYPGDEQLSRHWRLRAKCSKHSSAKPTSPLSQVTLADCSTGAILKARSTVGSRPGRCSKDDRLARLRKEILQAKDAWERSEAVRIALEQSQQCWIGMILMVPSRSSKALLSGYPDEDRLSKALARARDAAETKRREAAIEAACRNARSRMENRQFDEALAEVEHGLESFDNDTRLIEAREKILCGQSRLGTDEAIRQTLASARELVANDDPETALDLIEKAHAAVSGRTTIDCGGLGSPQIVGGETEGTGCTNGPPPGRFTPREAGIRSRLAVIEEASRTLGDDQRLTGLRREVESAQAAWVRSETVRNALRDSEQRLADSDPESAVQLLEAALARYPDETSLSQAAARRQTGAWSTYAGRTLSKKSAAKARR